MCRKAWGRGKTWCEVIFLTNSAKMVGLMTINCFVTLYYMETHGYGDDPVVVKPKPRAERLAELEKQGEPTSRDFPEPDELERAIYRYWAEVRANSGFGFHRSDTGFDDNVPPEERAASYPVGPFAANINAVRERVKDTGESHHAGTSYWGDFFK